MMILDFADLQKLSGYKRPHDVKKWLRSNGVAFMVQPSGRPVTTINSVNRALLGDLKRSQPDFSPLPRRVPRSKSVRPQSRNLPQ